MEMESILGAISSIGFPIVICLILLWYIKEMNITRKNETSAFTEALNKNTLVLQKICDKIDLEMENEAE